MFQLNVKPQHARRKIFGASVGAMISEMQHFISECEMLVRGALSFSLPRPSLFLCARLLQPIGGCASWGKGAICEISSREIIVGFACIIEAMCGKLCCENL